jgi:hypothetical protein
MARPPDHLVHRRGDLTQAEVGQGISVVVSYTDLRGAGRSIAATATDGFGATSDSTTSSPFGVGTTNPVVIGVTALPSDAIVGVNALVTLTLASATR